MGTLRLTTRQDNFNGTMHALKGKLKLNSKQNSINGIDSEINIQQFSYNSTAVLDVTSLHGPEPSSQLCEHV